MCLRSEGVYRNSTAWWNWRFREAAIWLFLRDDVDDADFMAVTTNIKEGFKMARKANKFPEKETSNGQRTQWINIPLSDEDRAEIQFAATDHPYDAFLLLLSVGGEGLDITCKRAKDGSFCAMAFFPGDFIGISGNCGISAFANSRIVSIVALSFKISKMRDDPTAFRPDSIEGNFFIR